jgi:hypothetical protein
MQCFYAREYRYLRLSSMVIVYCSQILECIKLYIESLPEYVSIISIFFLFIYMLSCYRFSHIASLIPSACCDIPSACCNIPSACCDIPSACCDIPPLETTKVPAYNAASKLDPLQTRNIKSKFPALVPTMNVHKFVCNIYAV